MPKKVTSNNNKYLTLLGFAALSSNPIMHIVIFSGSNQNIHAETRVNFTKDFKGNIKDSIFLEKN